VDRAALNAKLDKLSAMRGDPQHGLPAAAWAENLGGVERELLLRAAIAAVRELLIPEWASRRKNDLRPQRALDAAVAWLASPTDEAVAEAKGAAKACTAARNEFFGDDHRVPQAARSVAWAVGAKDTKDAAHIFEAFASVEDELLARIALMSEYHRAPEQRRALVDVLRRLLLPPEPAAAAPVAKPASEEPPAPYSADAHFALGQRLVHKKFGDITVTGAGETWIEVELPDGSKKRLAHKP
jgi:hypothetical protein